ncbi:MAG: hypothetical protein ACRDZP_00465 [Acidimicrobiales bacterium]
MLVNADATASEREARNEYLSNIDETWEDCRQAVETARDAYEEALESSRVSYEAQDVSASCAHTESIDQAWATYKETVANTASANRRTVIADARAAYSAAAARVRASFVESKTSARDGYLRAQREARMNYEAAVEGALAAHRQAIQAVTDYLDSPDTHSVGYLELRDAIAARSGDALQAASVPSSLELTDDDLIIESSPVNEGLVIESYDGTDDESDRLLRATLESDLFSPDQATHGGENGHDGGQPPAGTSFADILS